MRLAYKAPADTDVMICAVRSDNIEFEYEGSSWRITELKGLDTPPLELFTEKKGVGHGSLITGYRYDARDIDISARSQIRGNVVVDRASAVAFHDLSKTYKLVICYMGKIAIINGCRLQGFKITNKKTRENCEMEVSFLSPDPVMDTGVYETETVGPTGDTTGVYNYYPLTNCFTETALIRKIEFTATGDVREFYIGSSYPGVQFYFDNDIPSGSVVSIIPDREEGTVKVFADGRLVLNEEYSSGMSSFQTKAGNTARERILIYVRMGGSVSQPNIDITYAHTGETGVRGI